eukprot:TRINITY_DN46651_c0_g1_i1.p2 TRINITY_DN46651_c0_g1~~TRINITY_DN46651_c0_g1_i1.p2  ORF type:complete len:131 (+),score=30.15 TRINITY_DN46651_c0_g1_i1:143-535(+)
MEGLQAAVGDLASSWRNRVAIVRCMHSLKDTAVREEMNELQRQQVDEALDPPMGLIAAAASAYLASYAGLRKPLRARAAILQLAACGPAAVVLCLGGLCRSQGLVRSLLQGGATGQVAVALTPCSELLRE